MLQVNFDVVDVTFSAIADPIILAAGQTDLTAKQFKDKFTLTGGVTGGTGEYDNWEIKTAVRTSGGAAGLAFNDDKTFTVGSTEITGSVWNITFENDGIIKVLQVKFDVIEAEALVLKNSKTSIIMGKGYVLNAYWFLHKFEKDTGASDIGTWSITNVEHKGINGNPNDLTFDTSDKSLTANQVAALSSWTITFKNSDTSIGGVTLDVDFVVLEKSASDVKDDYTYSNEDQEHEWGDDSNPIAVTPWLNSEHGDIIFGTNGVKQVYFNTSTRRPVSSEGVVTGTTKPGVMTVLVKITGGTKYAAGEIDRFKIKFTKKTGEALSPGELTQEFENGKVINLDDLLAVISDAKNGSTVKSVSIKEGNSVAVNTDGTEVTHAGSGGGTTVLTVTLANELYKDITVDVTVIISAEAE